ncbi:MAG: MATE family efflux transporter [Acetatifactor sp.]
MDLTEGNITGKLVRFTIPIIIIQFLNQAYTLADNIVVARFVSEEALSVLSTVNSALLVAYCLMQGFSSAATILIGSLYGSRSYTKLRSTVKTLLGSLAAISFLIFIIYTLGAAPIFGLLKVPAQIQSGCKSVLWIYALSLPPTFLCSICTAALNGMGDSKTPMFISTGSQLLNIVLDILAVAVFGYGIVGAALASLFSVIIAMLLTWRQLSRMLKGLEGADEDREGSCIRQYMALAVPSILQQSIMSIGSLILQRLVNNQGVAYINGYTVACTLNNLFLLPVVSCCMGYETFAAQNLGAGKTDRVRNGFIRLLRFGLGLCVLLTLVTCLFAAPLIQLYLTDSAGTAFLFAKRYLLLLIPNYFLILAKNSVDGLFKAQQKVYLFTISSLIALGSRILLGCILEPSMGLTALAWATTAGNLIAALADWGVLLSGRRKARF